MSVGPLKEPAYRALVDDYLARLGRMVAAREVELPSPTGGVASDKLALAFERATRGSTRVALDVTGARMTSPVFARSLEGWGSRGKGVVSFLVGAADGLPEATLRSSEVRVSLSDLTLPHRLARLVLVEQLYRAMSILRGAPYAH